MGFLSHEWALLATLLTFAALLLWVLFREGKKIGGDSAAVLIMVGAVLILLAVMASLHLM